MAQTLRDVWIARGMTSLQVAGAAEIKSVDTLYRLLRKQGDENSVAYGTVKRVCKVLGLSLNDYEALDACPMSDKYKKSAARKG